MREGWEVRPLSRLCEVFTDGDWIESKDQSPQGIRLIQTGNIGEGIFKGRSDKARFVSPATFDRLRCTEIFEGDCLVSRLPDPVGRACILPATGERMITAVNCTIIRF
jgi:type I restriction enzyme S subunit